MKKLLSALVLGVTVASLSACSGEEINQEMEATVPTNVEESPAEVEEPTSNLDLPPMEVSVGETLTFGDYTWQVLDVVDGRALILTEDIIALRPFHHEMEFVSWATSDIRTYLNGEFLSRFNEFERARIAETTLTNNINPWFTERDIRPYLTSELLSQLEATNPEQFAEVPTTDRVFLLSLDELLQYFGDSGWVASPAGDESDWWVNDEFDEARVATLLGDEPWENGTLLAGESWSWWLRTSGYILNSINVQQDGSISMNGGTVDIPFIGLRPAMWLYLE